jgi:hypothetical protein
MVGDTRKEMGRLNQNFNQNYVLGCWGDHREGKMVGILGYSGISWG